MNKANGQNLVRKFKLKIEIDWNRGGSSIYEQDRGGHIEQDRGGHALLITCMIFTIYCYLEPDVCFFFPIIVTCNLDKKYFKLIF